MSASAPEPPVGGQVFISYSHEDSERVDSLRQVLESAGISVWMDRTDIETGTDWTEAERVALDGSAVVLVVWSRSSASSPNVLDQASAAADRDSIFPVTIDGFEVIPEPFARYQTIDLTEWKPGESHPGLDQVIGDLRRRLPLRMTLRPGAEELVGLAGQIANARRAGFLSAYEIVLAALYQPLHTRLDPAKLATGATAALGRALSDPAEPKITAALREGGVDLELLERLVESNEFVDDYAWSPQAAEAVARRVGATEVWAHHVVGEVLSGSEPWPAELGPLELGRDDLRAALRRSIAERWPEEDQAAWDEILTSTPAYQAQPTVARDYWTVEDHLQTRPYAEAIASFIRHDDTDPPLTIGIKAPWGAGKTSLMRMVQAELDPPKDVKAAVWTFPDIRLTKDAAAELAATTSDKGEAKRAAKAEVPDEQVSTAEALNRAKMAPQKPVELDSIKASELASQPSNEWRATVWFNPWMYQTGEEVWAGFAHEIIEQITGRLAPASRERFWLELNLRRVDRQAVRRRIYAVVFQKLLPALVVWLLATVGALISGVEGQVVSVASAGLLGAIAVASRVILHRLPASDAVSSLVSAPDLTGTAEGLRESWESSFDDVVPDPGYRSKAGFLQFVQTDIRHVLDLVATRERPLVIFVDDLDRCSPGVVAQTIEAINLFLAGQFPNAIFVLAIEPAVVAAHVEVAHKDLVERLKSDPLFASSWSTLGWRFLEKIVQLPLSLPQPSPTQTAAYLTSLFSADAPEAHTGDDDLAVQEWVDKSLPTIGSGGLATAATRLEEAEASFPEGLPPDAIAEARRRVLATVFEQSFNDGDPIVRKVIGEEAKQLPARNAREIKRLLNLFRFYSFIAVRNRVLDPTSEASIERTLGLVARLAALSIRWPYLLDVVARPGSADGSEDEERRPPILLEDLEAAASSDEAWEKVVIAAKLATMQGVPPVLHTESLPADLRDFCRGGPAIGEFARDFL